MSEPTCAYQQVGDLVQVPRAALAHIVDWHNKKPCGVGQESYDEVVFDVLLRALHVGHDDPDCFVCKEISDGAG